MGVLITGILGLVGVWLTGRNQKKLLSRQLDEKRITDFKADMREVYRYLYELFTTHQKFFGSISSRISDIEVLVLNSKSPSELSGNLINLQKKEENIHAEILRVENILLAACEICLSKDAIGRINEVVLQYIIYLWSFG